MEVSKRRPICFTTERTGVKVREAMIKKKIGELCLGGSIVVYILAALVLCSCPGLFAVAVVLAGVAMFSGTMAVRIGGVIMFGISVWGMIHDILY